VTRWHSVSLNFSKEFLSLNELQKDGFYKRECQENVFPLETEGRADCPTLIPFRQNDVLHVRIFRAAKDMFFGP
jgi:hypothetical protein